MLISDTALLGGVPNSLREAMDESSKLRCQMCGTRDRIRRCGICGLVIRSTALAVTVVSVVAFIAFGATLPS